MAALVITRVISIIDQHTICVDLGHKSVAAESPHPTYLFPECTGCHISVGQSEEHLVLKVADASTLRSGMYFMVRPRTFVPLWLCMKERWVLKWPDRYKV
jgi:hypothetical protein